MELIFLLLLIILMAISLGSGFPVAFALPGSAIISIGVAAFFGYLLENNADAYFFSGGPSEWLSAGVTNLRGVYWEVERDTLIAIPLFIFMGLMLQRSKIAEDLLVTMAQLFGPVRGGLGISVVFVGALLAATTGIVGATVVAMGLISLPAMLRNKYSAPLATGTIAASGTLGQIIPPSIVLIILADQLATASDQAGTMRKALYKEATGQISMPSIFDVTSTSAGEMFLGAFLPGILLVGIYMLFILVLAFVSPKSAPSVPYEGKMDKKFWLNVMLILIPPLTLIILVLGSIITGIATVNQAGAIGAAGAIIMAGYRQTEGLKSSLYPAFLVLISILLLAYAVGNYTMNVKLINTYEDKIGIFIGVIGSTLLLIALIWSSWRLFKFNNTMQGVMMETAKTTSLVFIILLGAAMLTAAFRAFGGEELVKEYLNSLPGGFWSKFIIVMLVIFILGFFLDFIEIAVVVVPIVAPILLADPSANITAVWLGVMIGLNIQTSFLTPPFGFALFYLRGVAPKAVKTIQMYKGVVPFIVLQILALIIVGANPSLVNYLPLRSSLVSDTAPPPKNPKLQYCLDSYILNELGSDKDKLSFIANIENQAGFDNLPKVWQKKLDQSIESAREASQQLSSIKLAESAVIEQVESFKPLLQFVRNIERDLRRQQENLEVLEARIEQSGEESAEVLKDLQERRQLVFANIQKLNDKKPENWDVIREEFMKLRDAETNARNMFRRSADNAFQEINDLNMILGSAEDFYAIEKDILSLRGKINNSQAEYVVDEIKSFTQTLSSIASASKVKSSLSKVRKELRKKKPKIEKALKNYEKAVEQYYEMKDHLEKSAGLRPLLQGYEQQLANTISIRQLDQIPRDVALYLARCNSGHRDLSLFF